MNRRKARKHANDILDYIVEESGYQADEFILKNARELLIITIMANREVSQGLIDSLVRIFKRIKKNKEKHAENTAAKTVNSNVDTNIQEIMI
jgi:hypothetical protein